MVFGSKAFQSFLASVFLDKDMIRKGAETPVNIASPQPVLKSTYKAETAHSPPSDGADAFSGSNMYKMLTIKLVREQRPPVNFAPPPSRKNPRIRIMSTATARSNDMSSYDRMYIFRMNI